MGIREKHGEWSVRDNDGLHRFSSEKEALAFLNKGPAPTVSSEEEWDDEDSNEDGGS